MLKIIFIILIALIIIAAFIFGVGLWRFEKQVVYSHGTIYDNTQSIEQTITDHSPSLTPFYFQAITNELHILYNTLFSLKPFMLFFK